MVSKSFLNLNIEKQKAILETAYEEFSNLEFSDVSFLQIAKKCNISRTSFYTYFTDKQDLYEYLIELLFDKIKKDKNREIPKVFTLEKPKLFFEFLCTFHGSEKHNFILMLLKNISLRKKNGFYIKEFKMDCEQKNEFFKKHKTLVFLVMSSVLFVGVRYFENEIDKQKANAEFDECMQILLNGIKGAKI